MFVDFFIRRPIFATVCALLIILAGAVCIPTLPVAQFPNLAPPTVSVGAGYNGANARSVETSVTVPLERAINGVEGMKYMTSSSGNDGSSGINIVFDITRDVDLAAVDVQNRVNSALGLLPNEVKNTGIQIQKSGNQFVLGAGVYAENGEYDSCSSATISISTSPTPSSGFPAWPASRCSTSADIPCACGSTHRAWPATD